MGVDRKTLVLPDDADARFAELVDYRPREESGGQGG